MHYSSMFKPTPMTAESHQRRFMSRLACLLMPWSQTRRSLNKLRDTFQGLVDHPDHSIEMKDLLVFPVKIEVRYLIDKWATMPGPMTNIRLGGDDLAFIPRTTAFLSERNAHLERQGLLADDSMGEKAPAWWTQHDLSIISQYVANWEMDLSWKLEGIKPEIIYCDVPQESFAEELTEHTCSKEPPEWKPMYHSTELGLPHTKLCMYSTVEGNGSSLLRSQLLTIVGAITTRIMDSDVKKFKVFHALLLSFMAPHHARITIASFDVRTRKLKIRMSDLLPADPENEASWMFIARYFGSRIKMCFDGKLDVLGTLLHARRRGTEK
ncbi:hypothetical protein BJX61DRAFT_547280 [Aspergillus egyptiacus]|nr:hypothetical protein BJX61DRAFT_547280 [Aspergillus egyptiacus]